MAERMALPRAWACGLWLLALPLAGLAAEPLPAAWPAPVARLDLSLVKPPYALVARPFFGERANGVDVIALDPQSLQPLSRSPTTLSCQRMHASANGAVLCFTNQMPGEVNHFTKPTSHLYTADLRKTGENVHATNGRPNRARMSADGQYSATTEFATGHSYLGVGGESFSTATRIVRNAAPATAEDLQTWPVTDTDGQKVSSPDLNFWGVTFHPADADRFYVTAYFAGRPRLAEGRISERSIRIARQAREDMECPSLSPDGRRLAFKKRTSATGWSPAVMDVATGQVRVFEVGSSVDDQIEWLNERTLVYEVVNRPLIGTPSSDLMALDIDAPRPAQRLWLAQARSPAFVRRR